MDQEKQSYSMKLQGYKALAMLVGAMSLAGSSVVVGKMLVATVPVFVAAFGSLLVAFVAILPLMHGRFGELRQLTAREWLYLFLQGLCGIVLFRVFTLYGLHMTGAVQAGIITGATPAVLIFCSLLLLAVPAVLKLRTMTSLPSTEALLAIVYYGVFATVLAYLLWTGAVGKVSGATAGAATAAMPASSVILAVLVLGEAPHWQHLAGCLLIVGGILVTFLRPAVGVRITPAGDRNNR